MMNDKIFCNDDLVVGCRMYIGPVGSKHGLFFSVAKEPTTLEEYISILEELTRMAKATEVEDKDLV